MTELTLKDKIIPWYFVLFFMVVALVDGTMVTIAVRTNSGLVTDHPYEKGLAYNDVVDAQNQQNVLGWHLDITMNATTLRVTVKDDKGKDILPDKITAHFSRPAQNGMDFEAEISPTGSAISFPAKGVWDARIYVFSKGDVYQQTKRMVIE